MDGQTKERILKQMKQDQNFLRHRITGQIVQKGNDYYIKMSDQEVLLPFSDEDSKILLHKMEKSPQHSYFELLQFRDTKEPILCMVFEKGSDTKALSELEEEVIRKYQEHYGI